ncbi:MAG: four helix bundle protein [Bacteroidota bacterium]
MTASEKSQQLEQRLINFAVDVLSVSNNLPKTFGGQHFGKQIIRSGSAPALLYAEARSAESDKDFRHKMSIALKELRETMVNLKIIAQSKMIPEISLEQIQDENNQLVSIFVAAIKSLDRRIKPD